MSIEVAERLITINPYAMAAITMAILGSCIVMGRVIFWLVKYIIQRHESENASIITDLKDAIESLTENLSATQESSRADSKQMREAIHEMSMSAQLMATTLREKIDQSINRVHERIDSTKTEFDTKLDEVHERVNAGNEERSILAAEISTLKGRCDDRARMCPHVRGGPHCHPDTCAPQQSVPA